MSARKRLTFKATSLDSGKVDYYTNLVDALDLFYRELRANDTLKLLRKGTTYEVSKLGKLVGIISEEEHVHGR